MNALAATADNLSNIFATLAPQVPAVSQNPAFLNLISVIFAPADTVAPTAAVQDVKPERIADALIRSMLGQSKLGQSLPGQSTPGVSEMQPSGVQTSFAEKRPAKAPAEIAVPVIANLPAPVPGISSASVQPGDVTPADESSTSATAGAEPVVSNLVAGAVPAPVVPVEQMEQAPGRAVALADVPEAGPLVQEATQPSKAIVRGSTKHSVPAKTGDRADRVAAGVAETSMRVSDVATVAGLQVSTAPFGRGSQDSINDRRGEAKVGPRPGPDSAQPQIPQGDAERLPVAGTAEVQSNNSSVDAEVAFQATLTPMRAVTEAAPVAAGQSDAPIAVVAAAPAPQALADSRDDSPIAPVQARAKDSQDPRQDSQEKDPDPREAGARIASQTAPATNFTRVIETAAAHDAPVVRTEVKPEAPFRIVAEALRASESAATATAQPAIQHASPLQEIALRIAQADAPAVELRVAERGGEIHVSVHTQDAGLQTSLRQDLGTLTNSLERAGYRAETYVPRENVGQTARSGQSDFRNDRESQPGFSGRGSGDSHQQGREQRRQREAHTAKWIQVLENVK